ncbi:TPA: hypothetical protein EYP12_00860 [Candidatus Bipolaricaulota bacterium]|nr:hypothetical protein [Candidatus Bipolaricaulota bacterium]
MIRDLALSRKVRLRKADQVGGSGILKELEPGLELTVKDLAALMMHDH